MEESLDFLQGMTLRQFLLTTLRGLLPSLLINVGCTLIIYKLLSPHFPSSSVIPLLIASLVPIFGNSISLLRHRRLDIFGVMMLVGLVVSIIAMLLGGSPRLLLIRESFTSGAIGLVLLVSMVFPRPLGYYFARHLLTANDPQKIVGFEFLWQVPFFRKFLQGATFSWGILLLGDLALRVTLAFTLSFVLVLTIAPIVSNALTVGGTVVSILWSRPSIMRIKELKKSERPEETMAEQAMGA
jgi:hypothetical protein